MDKKSKLLPIKEVPKLVLPPTTTMAEDLTTAGQRKVNLLWEYTQAFIAISVIIATLLIDCYITVVSLSNKAELTVTQLMGVTNLTALAMLVVGFYFSRTNHQAIGGVGSKPSQQYKGR